MVSVLASLVTGAALLAAAAAKVADRTGAALGLATYRLPGSALLVLAARGRRGGRRAGAARRRLAAARGRPARRVRHGSGRRPGRRSRRRPVRLPGRRGTAVLELVRADDSLLPGRWRCRPARPSPLPYLVAALAVLGRSRGWPLRGRPDGALDIAGEGPAARQRAGRARLRPTCGALHRRRLRALQARPARIAQRARRRRRDRARRGARRADVARRPDTRRSVRARGRRRRDRARQGHRQQCGACAVAGRGGGAGAAGEPLAPALPRTRGGGGRGARGGARGRLARQARARPRPSTSAATSTRPTAARTRPGCRGSTPRAIRCARATGTASTTSAASIDVQGPPGRRRRRRACSTPTGARCRRPRARASAPRSPTPYGITTRVDGAWYRCCGGRVRKLVDCCSTGVDAASTATRSLRGYCYGSRKVFCVMYYQTKVPC